MGKRKSFSMSVKAALPEGLPRPYGGSLVESLTQVVESAEGTDPVATKPRPTLTLKPPKRDFLRLTSLRDDSFGVTTRPVMNCVTVDCHRDADLLLDSRDSEALPYCMSCAWVEFAQWMAGV